MASSSGRITEELICSICLEVFDTPVLLPCAHTFCKQCLVNVQERRRIRTTTQTQTRDGNPGPSGPEGMSHRTITCPQCRKEVKLGTEGVGGLPKNTSLANIILSIEEDKKSNNILCEVCDYEPAKTASKVCADCAVTYCLACFRQLHPMRGTFKYHVIKEANRTSMLRSCSSPVFDSRASGRFTPSRDGYGTDGAESGDEGIYANQDQIEKIRRQIKSKRRELNSVTKAVQNLLKTTEDETEERMREVRSACCEINESIGEKEAAMLTIVSQKRHEAVRQCLSLSSEVKAQLLTLDLLEDQVNDIVSVSTVHTGTDVSNDVAGLQEKVTAVQSRSLSMRSKLVPRQPRLCETSVFRHIAALDFVKDNTLLSPVLTEIVYRPVSTGPAVIEITWRPMEEVLNIRLAFTKKDNQGLDVTSSVDLPGSMTSYTMKLDSVDAEYYFTLLATSDEGMKHPQVGRNVRTLPYINCYRARFSPTHVHKRVAVSTSRDEIVHRKCKLSALNHVLPASTSAKRLENIEGVAAEDPLPLLPYVYWEIIVHFRVFGKLGNSKLLCDLGVCKTGSEDESALLCDNLKSYCCYLVRRGDKVALEFWNGPNGEILPRSVPVLDLTQDSEKVVKLGFYWNALKRTFAIVSPGPNSVILAQFQVRFPTLTPMAGLYCWDQVFVMVKLTDTSSHKLPSVLAKLIMS